MAESKIRVRLLRTVQGEGTKNDEREIHVKGSVLDIRSEFAHELVASKAAEYAPDDKLAEVPLHPKEPAAAAK